MYLMIKNHLEEINLRDDKSIKLEAKDSYSKQFVSNRVVN